MKKSYKKCPLCNSGHFNLMLTVKDHSVSKEEFDIMECINCKLLFTNPYPSKEEIGRYYQSPDYISHTDRSTGFINYLYKLVRKITLRKKIKYVNKFKAKTLLDVGCGTGHFLQQAHMKGYTVNGVETEEKARELIHPDLKENVFSSINALPEKLKFDVITMWHVLEHVHDLHFSFEKVTKHLNPGGHILVAVPNPESYDAKKYARQWAAWDVPRHLYHFRFKQVKLLFKNHNLLLINVLPQHFDSYYVSMLSEKYKGKNVFSQIIFGMIYGFLSNFKASKKEYSSLIYIGKKQ